jgi:hypothetical protein
VFVLAAALLAWFMIVSGWAVLRVSVMAIWTTVIVLPSLWLGAIPGAPQRRAADVVWQFFAHGIQTLIYIVYVSVVGLAVERIVSAPLPAELGGANPFAHVLMMGGVAIAALMLLRHIRSDVSGRRGGGGLWRQASSVAVGMGMTAALGGAGSAAAQGIRAGRRRLDSKGEPAPWERMDEDATSVHGRPQTGFDPVPALGVAPGADAAKPRTRERGGTERYEVKDRGAPVGERVAEVDGVSTYHQAATSQMTDHSESGGTSDPGRETSQRETFEPAVTAMAPDEDAPSLPAIVETEHRGATSPRPNLGEEEPSPIDDEGAPPLHRPNCD